MSPRDLDQKVKGWPRILSFLLSNGFHYFLKSGESKVLVGIQLKAEHHGHVPMITWHPISNRNQNKHLCSTILKNFTKNRLRTRGLGL
jgi:hypothetical protein